MASHRDHSLPTAQDHHFTRQAGASWPQASGSSRDLERTIVRCRYRSKTISNATIEEGEMIMNAKKRIVRTLAAVMLTFVFFHLQQPTSAQSGKSGFDFRGNLMQQTLPSSAKSNCKIIRGNGVQVFDPATGIISGPVTNSGLLDGSLEDVIDFGAGFIFTPDPTVVAYTTDLTITTNHGQLKASPVNTQSVVTAVGSEWGHIDSDNSTGRFAGATGAIFITFKPVGDPSVGPYEAEITADICFGR
jgi:hypothetical protein